MPAYLSAQPSSSISPGEVPKASSCITMISADAAQALNHAGRCLRTMSRRTAGSRDDGLFGRGMKPNRAKRDLIRIIVRTADQVKALQNRALKTLWTFARKA